MPGKELPENIVALIETPPISARRAEGEAGAYFRGIAPQLAPCAKELAKLTARRDALTGPPVMNKYNQNKIGTIARTLISVSGPPRVVRVLPRGNWQDDSGEVVTAGVPAVIAQIEIPSSAGRAASTWPTGSSRATTRSPQRCFVNRLWKMFYGDGNGQAAG
jgi:hypothetical protein